MQCEYTQRQGCGKCLPEVKLRADVQAVYDRWIGWTKRWSWTGEVQVFPSNDSPEARLERRLIKCQTLSSFTRLYDFVRSEFGITLALIVVHEADVRRRRAQRQTLPNPSDVGKIEIKTRRTLEIRAAKRAAAEKEKARRDELQALADQRARRKAELKVKAKGPRSYDWMDAEEGTEEGVTTPAKPAVGAHTTTPTLSPSPVSPTAPSSVSCDGKVDKSGASHTGSDGAAEASPEVVVTDEVGPALQLEDGPPLSDSGPAAEVPQAPSGAQSNSTVSAANGPHSYGPNRKTDDEARVKNPGGSGAVRKAKPRRKHRFDRATRRMYDQPSGYCYLYCVANRYHEEAKKALGKWPRKIDLAKWVEAHPTAYICFGLRVNPSGRSLHMTIPRTRAEAVEGWKLWVQFSGAVRVGGCEMEGGCGDFPLYSTVEVGGAFDCWRKALELSPDFEEIMERPYFQAYGDRPMALKLLIAEVKNIMRNLKPYADDFRTMHYYGRFSLTGPYLHLEEVTIENECPDGFVAIACASMKCRTHPEGPFADQISCLEHVDVEDAMAVYPFLSLECRGEVLAQFRHQEDVYELFEVIVGVDPNGALETAVKLDGPKMMMPHAQEALNASYESMPTISISLTDAQLARLSEAIGRNVRSSHRRTTWNDHPLLESMRELIRSELAQRFPHNVDTHTVAHFGSTTHEVKTWLSHAGHDFYFSMKDDKDTARTHEDVVRLISGRLQNLALPSITSRRGFAVRVEFESARQALSVLELDGRRRFYYGDTPERKYDMLFWEDSLYDVGDEQFAKAWLDSNASVGYATMFFPHAMLGQQVETSTDYRYEEYYPDAEYMLDRLDDVWPGILAFSPLLPVLSFRNPTTGESHSPAKGAAHMVHETLKWVLKHGFASFVDWLKRARDDEFPLELVASTLFDITKWGAVMRHIFRKLAPVIRQAFVRVRVTWANGHSNGYDHRLKDWNRLLVKPRIPLPDGRFVDSEIVSRVGEMYLVRMWVSNGASPIARVVELPAEMATVLVADIERAYNRVTRQLHDIQYIPFRATTVSKILNWCLAEPIESLTFGVVLTAVNRISGGLSVGSNIIAPKLHHDPRHNSLLALAMLMETYKRSGVLIAIEGDEDLKNGWTTNLETLAKTILKAGLTVITGGLAIPAYYIYKWLMTEKQDYEFLKWPDAVRTTLIPGRKVQARSLAAGPITMVLTPQKAKGKVECFICDSWASGHFSMSGEPSEGQCFHLENHEADNSHDLGISSKGMVTLLQELRDAEAGHASIGAVKLVATIHELVEYAQANPNGIDHRCNVNFIRGGPGTGKTELIKAMMYRLNKLGIHCAVTAPFNEVIGDYANAKVIGAEGTQNFNADTFWYTFRNQANVHTLFADEVTAINWPFLKLMVHRLGVKELVLVGDPLQTRLDTEKNQGCDVTNPASDLDWARVPNHDLVYQYRMDAWRTKLYDHIWGYRMVAKRTDELPYILLDSQAYKAEKEVTPVQREIVFAHDSGEPVFGQKSTNTKPGINLSARSAQGMTYDRCAVSASELDKGTFQVHGMANVAGSRSRYQTFIVAPGSTSDDFPQDVARFYHVDSKDRIDAISRLPWPALPEVVVRYAQTHEQRRATNMLARMKELGKVTIECAKGETDVMLDGVFVENGGKVDLEVEAQETSAEQYSQLAEVYRGIFHTCLFDALEKSGLLKDEVDRSLVEWCEKLNCDDYAMGRSSALKDFVLGEVPIERRFLLSLTAPLPKLADSNGVVKHMLPTRETADHIERTLAPLIIFEKGSRKSCYYVTSRLSVGLSKQKPIALEFHANHVEAMEVPALKIKYRDSGIAGTLPATELVNGACVAAIEPDCKGFRIIAESWDAPAIVGTYDPPPTARDAIREFIIDLRAEVGNREPTLWERAKLTTAQLAMDDLMVEPEEGDPGPGLRQQLWLAVERAFGLQAFGVPFHEHKRKEVEALVRESARQNPLNLASHDVFAAYKLFSSWVEAMREQGLVPVEVRSNLSSEDGSLIAVEVAKDPAPKPSGALARVGAWLGAQKPAPSGPADQPAIGQLTQAGILPNSDSKQTASHIDATAIRREELLLDLPAKTEFTSGQDALCGAYALFGALQTAGSRVSFGDVVTRLQAQSGHKSWFPVADVVTAAASLGYDVAILSPFGVAADFMSSTLPRIALHIDGVHYTYYRWSSEPPVVSVRVVGLKRTKAYAIPSGEGKSTLAAERPDLFADHDFYVDQAGRATHKRLLAEATRTGDWLEINEWLRDIVPPTEQRVLLTWTKWTTPEHCNYQGGLLLRRGTGTRANVGNRLALTKRPDELIVFEDWFERNAALVKAVENSTDVKAGRKDDFEKSTYKRVSLPDDLSHPDRRLYTEHISLTSSYAKRRTILKDSPPGSQKLRSGTDAYKLASFLVPNRGDRSGMLNVAGPTQGLMRPNNAEINWLGAIFDRTKGKAPKLKKPSPFRHIAPGLANSFGKSAEETLLASERVAKLGIAKAPLNGESKAWADKLADEAFESCFHSGVAVEPEEANRIVLEAVQDAKRKNYGERARVEYRKQFGRPVVICSNKPQQKPIKNGKLDILKTGQMISQCPAEFNARFVAPLRVNGANMKAATQEHVFMDDFEDPSAFRLRMTNAIQAMPECARFGVMDFVEFDSQQGPVTKHMEMRFMMRLGVSREVVDDYYRICGDTELLYPGLFKAKGNQDKGSGFPTTKSGNSIISLCLGHHLFTGIGPKLHAFKGDDTLVVQAGLEEKPEARKAIKAFTKMDWSLDIGDGGEFIGNSVSRAGMFPSVTRVANKAIAKPAASYELFKAHQQALRDTVAEWVHCGINEVICYSALAEKASIPYVEACFAFVNSWSHVSKRQWMDFTCETRVPVFHMRSADGPTVL